MDILCVDVESRYTKEYSLSKMPTAAYIEDARFEVIGVAVKKNDEPTQWFSGTHEKAQHWLASFDWANSAALAHNALFDATILAWRFGIYPKLILDTLSMARAVHGTEVGGSLKALARHYEIGEKGTEVLDALGKGRKDFTEQELQAYASYCINDVELTYALFKRLAPHFNKTELKLIDLTIRMHSEPKLSLDTAVLLQSLDEIRDAKEKALIECGIEKEDLMSNPKFAEVLRKIGVEPPMKVSPTTGKQTYAFAKKDEELLALLEHDDIRVQSIVAARLKTKETLEETKTQRLIEVAERSGVLPVGLKYYGAEVSGRWSAGGDGGALQLQNIARKSRIKEAIIPPLGYSIVGLDLSNVEVRVNLYLSGQQDQLDIIKEGLDIYRDFGSKAFNVGYDEITKGQRYVSKCAVLGLGFGAGAKVLCKAINIGAKQYGFEVDVDEKEAKRIVDVYREVNNKVVKAWYQGNDVLEAIRDNAEYTYAPGFLPLGVEGSRGIRLPSGLYIKYPNLAYLENEEGKIEWQYEGRRGVKKRIYGPKVLQNCISEGTLVLTRRGWIPIEKVALNDYVHDGEVWVGHGGVVFQSVQSCVRIDGVWMTPDHEVLTNEGWKTASQNPEPYRPKIWISDSNKTGSQRWKETLLGIPLRLWKSVRKSWAPCGGGIQACGNPQLRVHDSFIDRRKERKTRYVKTPGISGMGQHESQMSESSAPSIQKLWSAWGKSVRQVEAFFRELLGGYGTFVPEGAGAGSHRQQRGLHPRELPVGRSSHKHNEQEVLDTVGYSKTVCGVWDWANDVIQQAKSWMASGAPARQTGFQEQERKVYDILDCGPRNRFVVLGEEGPFIVHNCTQAVARCILAEAMVKINQRYPIALCVHDSCVIVVPSDEAEEAYRFMLDTMVKPPKWAPNIPLAAEGAIGNSLKECV